MKKCHIVIACSEENPAGETVYLGSNTELARAAFTAATKDPKCTFVGLIKSARWDKRNKPSVSLAREEAREEVRAKAEALALVEAAPANEVPYDTSEQVGANDAADEAKANAKAEAAFAPAESVNPEAPAGLVEALKGKAKGK
jgi:hypothetical protein